MQPEPKPQPLKALRSADQVVRLARMGAFHQTRLSFLRQLLRRIDRERWTFSTERFAIDARGVGVAVTTIQSPTHAYSLVAFAHDLAPEKRTDRVIAEAWDATFVLFDGIPGDADIERLQANVPLQEAGRCLDSELVLARANRSVRLFDTVVADLADGRQPDAADIDAIGYLMRTTAVYGNGKFGISDRERFAERPEMAAPFQAEMLTVWLIRHFTIQLVEHLARVKGGVAAATLAPDIKRRLGIGNATGLGMAPFLVRHPALLNAWHVARETALARVRSQVSADAGQIALVKKYLQNARAALPQWTTDDPVQAPRIAALARDLATLSAHIDAGILGDSEPWDRLYHFAENNLSLEGQEFVISLILEPNGALIDDLADSMAVDERTTFRIEGHTRCVDLRSAIARDYAWALTIDFADLAANHRFWYVSEEKLEPRLGLRHTEPGADREQPLAVARDVSRLHASLADAAPDERIAQFLLRHPEHRHTVRRVQIGLRAPYAEIRDNLIDESLRAIDLLRCKLSFFGATRFDPKSDKWLRITLFQGAPFPDDIGHADFDFWV
jgi:hypothetical protein